MLGQGATSQPEPRTKFETLVCYMLIKARETQVERQRKIGGKLLTDLGEHSHICEVSLNY
jgi:hypothetical protein